jgi:hypothetical protein
VGEKFSREFPDQRLRGIFSMELLQKGRPRKRRGPL